MSEVNTTPRAHNFQDITGTKIGYLTVLMEAGRDKYKRAKWLCRCDCGKEVVIHASNLKRRHTVSCGCQRKAMVSAKISTHGHAKRSTEGVSPTFSAWCEMIRRCTNQNCKSFKDYGGRGIKVYGGWRKDFAAFLAHVGERPSDNHSLDRIDVNGHYEPGNVRWSTRKEQMRNKRTNRMVSHDGLTLSVAEWAERLGVNYGTIYSRLIRKGSLT